MADESVSESAMARGPQESALTRDLQNGRETALEIGTTPVELCVRWPNGCAPAKHLFEWDIRYNVMRTLVGFEDVDFWRKTVDAYSAHFGLERAHYPRLWLELQALIRACERDREPEVEYTNRARVLAWANECTIQCLLTVGFAGLPPYPPPTRKAIPPTADGA